MIYSISSFSHFSISCVCKLFAKPSQCRAINSDLQRSFEWAEANEVKFNPKKNQVILMHRPRIQISPPQHYIGPDDIKVVPTGLLILVYLFFFLFYFI
jgi:hypothetical protein